MPIRCKFGIDFFPLMRHRNAFLNLKKEIRCRSVRFTPLNSATRLSMDRRVRSFHSAELSNCGFLWVVAFGIDDKLSVSLSMNLDAGQVIAFPNFIKVG